MPECLVFVEAIEESKDVFPVQTVKEQAQAGEVGREKLRPPRNMAEVDVNNGREIGEMSCCTGEGPPVAGILHVARNGGEKNGKDFLDGVRLLAVQTPPTQPPRRLRSRARRSHTPPIEQIWTGRNSAGQRASNISRMLRREYPRLPAERCPSVAP